MFKTKKVRINRHLFYETSHSPALIDIVGPQLIKKVIDFCFVANPYYPDYKLLKKLQKCLPYVIKAYPSSNPGISQCHLASVLNVNSDNIIIGNGATELITIIEKDLIDDIAIPIPTFSEYTDKIRKQESAKLFQLPADNNYKLNLDKYASWINENNITSALIINPGNPTGELIDIERMISFLDKMQHLKMIIVDESFVDFAGIEIPTLLPHINKYNNLMIVRSMSKHCGIPGLRLGYICTANNDFLSKLRKLLPVWNINTLAEFFLKNLHATNNIYHKARIRVISDVSYLYTSISKIPGFYIYPTGSNFILIKSECGLNATELQQLLLEKYYLYVRDCSNKIGLDNMHIRVASQGIKKDKKLIKALVNISKEYYSDKK